MPQLKQNQSLKLGDVIDIRDGTHDSPQYIEQGIPLITSKNLTDSGLCFRDVSFISEDNHKEISKRSAVERGDILYGMIGTIGKPTLVDTDRSFSIKNVALFKQSNQNISNRYLLWLLNSQSINKQIAQASRGGTQKFVSLGVLRRLEAIFPPLPEQVRIASILDQADALRVKRREALAQLDSLTQAIFIEMFGDPRENEKKWVEQSIATFISDMRGGASIEPDDFIESGFPILHKGGIKPQGQIHLDAKKKTFVATEYAVAKPQCVVNRNFVAVTLRDLVPSGPSIGLVADLRDGPFDEYVLAQGAYAFRIAPEKVTTEYFVHLSNMPTFRYVLLQNAVGSTQIHIRTPIYLAIKVPVPPIEFQRKFSQRVRAIESMRRQHRASLLELESLFSSLQHRAFRGEL